MSSPTPTAPARSPLQRVRHLIARWDAWWDDWRQIVVLRDVLLILMLAVSSYYLYWWAVANAMPWWLAWTLPAAVDVTALQALKVARRARSNGALVGAIATALGCLAVSVAGNVGQHLVELGTLIPDTWTVIATAAVYPVSLLAGHAVSFGASDRPAPPVPVADPLAEHLAAEQTRAQLVTLLAHLSVATAPPAPVRMSRRVRAAERRVADRLEDDVQDDVVTRDEAPITRDVTRDETASVQVTAPSVEDTQPLAAVVPAVDEVPDLVDLNEQGDELDAAEPLGMGDVDMDQLAALVAAWRKRNPGSGRRVMGNHLRDQGWPVKDSVLKKLYETHPPTTDLTLATASA